MKNRFVATCAALLAPVILSMGAVAQVYETTDEEGNVSFSDVPTPGAEKVQIDQTNTAESVEVRPYEPSEPAPARAPAGSDDVKNGPVYVGGDDDYEDMIARQRTLERREQAREHLSDGEGVERPATPPQAAPQRPRPHRR